MVGDLWLDCGLLATAFLGLLCTDFGLGSGYNLGLGGATLLFGDFGLIFLVFLRLGSGFNFGLGGTTFLLRNLRLALMVLFGLRGRSSLGFGATTLFYWLFGLSFSELVLVLNLALLACGLLGRGGSKLIVNSLLTTTTLLGWSWLLLLLLLLISILFGATTLFSGSWLDLGSHRQL